MRLCLNWSIRSILLPSTSIFRGGRFWNLFVLLYFSLREKIYSKKVQTVKVFPEPVAICISAAVGNSCLFSFLIQRVSSTHLKKKSLKSVIAFSW
jgi:hypothetical protein